MLCDGKSKCKNILKIGNTIKYPISADIDCFVCLKEVSYAPNSNIITF